MRLSDVLDFLESPVSIGWDLAPETAISYLRDKGLAPGFDVASASAAERASSFWVANIADKDMLGELLESLTTADEKGTPYEEWADSIIPQLQARGWWGRREVIGPDGRVKVQGIDAPHRLQTIFRANMQAAYAVGQWERIIAQAESAPYLLYDAVDDHRTRPLHEAWDGTVLPVTHAWWRTHMPPNGWNCRCGVIQMSQDEMDALDLAVSKVPTNGTYEWTNPRTGKRHKLPEGIDPGFDYNPGAERLAELQRLAAEKAKALPPEPRAQVEASIRATQRAIEQSFDTTTQAGAWHSVSWKGAPDWMLPAVVREQMVQVTSERGGAYAIASRTINMPPSYRADSASHRSTWRHEFGHILDHRIGTSAGRAGHISAGPEFTEAMTADARDLATRTFVRDSRQAAKRAAYLSEYTALQGRLVDMGTPGARQLYLRDRASAIGIDLDALRTALSANSAALFETLAGDIRVARILHAIESRDPERFLAEAAGMEYGTPQGAGNIPELRAEVWATVRSSWQKGLLGHFADMIGASTRNRIAGYNSGYPGHSEAYYRKRAGYGQQIEAFANLVALAGAPESIWWDLARRFMPRIAQTFEVIIRGY